MKSPVFRYSLPLFASLPLRIAGSVAVALLAMCATHKEAADVGPETPGASTDAPVAQAAKPEVLGTLYQLKEVNPAPALVSSKPVNYTYEMVKNKVEGFVTARLLVDKDGRVKDVEIVKELGHGTREETIRTLMEYRFTPAQKDGRSVAVWISMTVNFKPLGI